MILRIFRGRVAEHDEGTLTAFVRDQAIEDALRTPGLLSFQPAARDGDDGLELVIVSTWTDFADLLASSAALDSPVTMPRAAPIVTDGRSHHFELVVGGARGLPLHRARLRIVDSPLRPQAEAPYFERARVLADELLDDTGMLAFDLGRRTVGTVNHAVAVTLWESQGAIDEAIGRERTFHADPAMADFYAGPATVEHFDALIATEPQPDAPALLLADDTGRYLYATPAAATLTGRSVARLLTMQVSDIAASPVRPIVADMWNAFMSAGVQVGDFDLQRPDGSSATVHFAAKTNTPWPGCHTSVLTPVAEPPFTDVERALSRAGLVARYAVGV